MPILHIHRNSILILDRARVFVEDNRVVYEQAMSGYLREWNIPHENLSCLILCRGCSITTEATRLLSETRTYVMHAGSGGTPIFMSSIIDYRPTRYFQKWIRFWHNPDARLAVAKFLAQERCKQIQLVKENHPAYSLLSTENIQEIANTFECDIDKAKTIPELMGYEANLATKLYSRIAKNAGIGWSGRDNSQTRNSKDDLNKMIDDGNYLSYGIAACAIYLTGLVPQMPVTHGATRKGGLVFDIADVFKDTLSLTCAVSSASEGMRPGSEFRKKAIGYIEKTEVLRLTFSVIERATEIGFSYVNSPEDLKTYEEDIISNHSSGILNKEVNFIVNLLKEDV